MGEKCRIMYLKYISIKSSILISSKIKLYIDFVLHEKMYIYIYIYVNLQAPATQERKPATMEATPL